MPETLNSWTRPAIFSTAVLVALLLYPERVSENMIGALFTVILLSLSVLCFCSCPYGAGVSF